MKDIENGISITLEEMGNEEEVKATLLEGRLTLSLGDKQVCLTQGETVFFLAQMATWYEQQESPAWEADMKDLSHIKREWEAYRLEGDETPPTPPSKLNN